LRQGGRVGDKNAVRDASGAVESAMKALLDAYGVPRTGKEPADSLWELLDDKQIVDRKSRDAVLAAPHIGNTHGRHGKDPKHPDPVPRGIPALAVQSAAAALVYLAGQLPN